MVEKVKKLQGIVTTVEKTEESLTDKEGIKWKKCIFNVELTNFSRRTPEETLPTKVKGKKVKLIRYCAFDWHYKTGVKKTLEPDETEAVLKEKPLKTIYW